jgi:hypothetical protein
LAVVNSNMSLKISNFLDALNNVAEHLMGYLVAPSYLDKSDCILTQARLEEVHTVVAE